MITYIVRRTDTNEFETEINGSLDWTDNRDFAFKWWNASIAEENKKSGQKKLINREVFIDCFCDALKQDFYANSSKD